MTIEGFLAINLTADFVLLASVSRAFGLFSWRRVLAADAACSALAILSEVQPALGLIVAAASPAMAAAIITRRTAPKLWAMFTLALLGDALLCGGIAYLLAPSSTLAAPLCLGAGALLTLLISAGRPPGNLDWQTTLCLRVGNRSARFPALIDTGNRLREPLSGLPVLIAEAPLVRDILPETGYRTLNFGVVGGTGRMTCFRPDALWIGSGRKRRRGPDIWVAVSPEPLPGLCQALAPPEFASYY